MNFNPALLDLISPQDNKDGWPWGGECPTHDISSTSGECLKISIVIPSYNQGGYIEEAIRSVILQGYPALELIVVDGGSNDSSVEIIEKYSRFIDYWVSERDRGQADAINKGLQKCTGDIWAYLNSDDLLMPGSLAHVNDIFISLPKITWVSGATLVFGQNIDKKKIEANGPKSSLDVLAPWYRRDKYIFPVSVSCFMRRSIFESIGLFDESLHYSMDIEYYTRAYFAGYRQHITERTLGSWRWHEESKTLKEGVAYGFRGDEIDIAKRYIPHLDSSESELLSYQIRAEEKWLIVRKAMFLNKQGRTIDAFKLLSISVLKLPSLLWFRPWIGALRRVIQTSL